MESNAEGKFQFTIEKEGEYHVIVSHLGCESEQYHLDLVSDTFIEIFLHHYHKHLKEVKIGGKAPALSETIESIQSLIDENLVSITTDFSEQADVLYHKNYLLSLFFNLITNSIRFKQPAINPQIVITSKQVSGKTVLTYTDNGLGFDLEKIGDKVFGLHQHFHHHPNSRGLGLYLIKTQLTSLGGTISLSSSPNQGATFTITF